MTTTQSIQAGANSAFIGFKDARGLFAGFSKLTQADTGSGSGARRLKGVVNFPNPIPEAGVTPTPGDDGNMGSFNFVSSDAVQGQAEFAASDVDLEASLINTLAWTLGPLKIGTRGLQNPEFEDAVILVHQQAKSLDSGSRGAQRWLNLLYPTVQMLPMGAESAAHQAVSNNRYTCTFDYAGMFPVGQDFSASNIGVEQSGVVLWWIDSYKWLLQVKIGNATWDTITLDETPIDVTHTIVGQTTTADAFSTITPDAVTPSTKLVELPAAPPSGAFVVVLYAVARLS